MALVRMTYWIEQFFICRQLQVHFSSRNLLSLLKLSLSFNSGDNVARSDYKYHFNKYKKMFNLQVVSFMVKCVRTLIGLNVQFASSHLSMCSTVCLNKYQKCPIYLFSKNGWFDLRFSFGWILLIQYFKCKSESS